MQLFAIVIKIRQSETSEENYTTKKNIYKQLILKQPDIRKVSN